MLTEKRIKIVEIQAGKDKPAFSEHNEIKLWENIHKIGCVHPRLNCKSPICVIISSMMYATIFKKEKNGKLLSVWLAAGKAYYTAEFEGFHSN